MIDIQPDVSSDSDSFFELELAEPDEAVSYTYEKLRHGTTDLSPSRCVLQQRAALETAINTSQLFQCDDGSEIDFEIDSLEHMMESDTTTFNSGSTLKRTRLGGAQDPFTIRHGKCCSISPLTANSYNISENSVGLNDSAQVFVFGSPMRNKSLLFTWKAPKDAKRLRTVRHQRNYHDEDASTLGNLRID